MQMILEIYFLTINECYFHNLLIQNRATPNGRIVYSSNNKYNLLDTISVTDASTLEIGAFLTDISYIDQDDDAACSSIFHPK